MANINIIGMIIKLILIIQPSFIFSHTTYCYTSISGSYRSCAIGNWTFFRDNDSDIKIYFDKIEITNKKINVFQNKALENISSSSIKSLQLNLANKQLEIEPLAFSNLPSLENLEINSASVFLDSDTFHGLNNLKYLKIQVIKETKPLLNDLLQKHQSLNKLEFVNNEDADICDFTRQNNSLNIVQLKYTGGYIQILTRQSFICLKNLQHLTITESRLTLIVHGTFDGLKKLKKLYLTSNKKLTHILSNVFNTVRSLEVIDLSNNSINKIDKGAFVIESKKLSLLNLSYNSLEIIDEGIFQNIHCNLIDFRKNEIFLVFDGAFNGSHIRKIYLFDNYLFTLNYPKWGLNKNTIVYFKYKDYDIALNKLENNNICYSSENDYFRICKTSSMKLKSVEHFLDNWQPETLEITDDTITSIEDNTFQNLSIKILIINSAVTAVTLFPASFAGLKQLEVLKLNTKPIQINSFIFDCLTSLRFLEISIDQSSSIPLCQLFKNLEFFDNLLLTHQDRVDICDEKLCTNNDFKITSLHYENGKLENLQQLAFSCLKQLEYLAITNSSLKTIESTAFDGLDSIKYLSLSSNQIKSIDNKPFMNKNLTMLDLSYNLLTHIKNDTFSDVKTNVLDISYNKITKIDDGAFKDMNLRHIYYYSNVGYFDDTRYWYIDNSQIETNCDIRDTYRICKKGKTLTSVDLPNQHVYSTLFFSSIVKWLKANDTLEIFDDRISAIGKYVFKDSPFTNYLKTLNLNNNIKGEFTIYPESFDGLPNLKNLILDVGPIALKENSFDRLTSLNYLRIEIKYNPKSPLRYINNVLKTVPSIRVLEILNSDSINICDNPISNENSLPLTGLYYTGGSIGVLPTNSLICLLNLEKLSISKTQLMTIEAGVFDSLDNLKYINLAFNKINYISTGIFDNLNKLISLELNNNKINGINSKSLMKSSNNNLKLINLSYNEISIIKKDTFEGVNCSQLDLSHNKISHIEDNAFKDTKIHDIFLFNNNIITPIKETWKIHSFTIAHLKKPRNIVPYCTLETGTRINCDHCQFRSCVFIGSRYDRVNK